jgi:hypothetical protein
MIVKSRERRGLTLTRIIPMLAEVVPVFATLPVGAAPATPVEHQTCPKWGKMIRTRQEHGKIRCHLRSALNGNTHYKRDMKWRCAILMLITMCGYMAQTSTECTTVITAGLTVMISWFLVRVWVWHPWSHCSSCSDSTIPLLYIYNA